MKKIKFQALLIAIFLFTVSLWTNAQECTNCQSSIVSGISASALGFGNQAIGNGSTVIGFESITKSQGGIAIGKHLEIPSHLHYTIAIGSGYNEDNMLINTVGPSLFVGFGSTKPTFFVGESIGINSTGRIGIGNVTTPQAKLHIRADELEDANLLLEASAGGQAKVILSEWHEIAYETDENLHLRTAQSKAFVFHRGDIFIEDIQSGIIMRSPNGQCWRGRVNDQGMLAFEQTECPTAETALPEHGQEEHLMRVFPNPASKHLEVVADGLNGSYTLRLLTATGQLMLEQQSRATHTQLNIQNLPSGTYLLVLEQDGQMKDSVKVLVE